MSEIQDTLTSSEQIQLVNGASFFGTSEIAQKNIPRIQMLDGGTGINFEQLFGDIASRAKQGEIGGDTLRNVITNFYEPKKLHDEDSKKLHKFIKEKLQEIIPSMTPPGCYPPGIMLSATWNPEIINKVGHALGQEARAYGINILLGTPNINLHRDIRNGRLFEGYSEDPYLISILAPELVKGLQSEGVGANVKHFAANNQETNRMNINELIPERALFELYFPGFKACVKAGAATVMSAYNRINGIPCTENRSMLHDLLREKWGFDGVVMSDWNAVYHPADALNAGNDLAMPGPIAPDTLENALQNGTLSEDALKISSSRIAKLARKYAQKPNGDISVEQTDKTAFDAASEGIILLKNHNNTLPLTHSSKISLFGKHCDALLTCGEGSAGVITTRNIKMSNALLKRFQSVYLNRYESDTDTFIYVYSTPGQEGNDRYDISISKNELEECKTLLNYADEKNLKKILVLNVSSPIILGGLEDRFDAVFCIFLPGMQGANALSDCLCGKINPSGKLPLTWPAQIEDTPAYLNFPGDGMQVNYGEGIFVGYRWFDARKISPLYPFGHGLSYTAFEISSLTAENNNFTDSVNVTATVKNTGKFDGKTVIQIYISDIYSTLTKPIRELKAFQKVFLSAGEQKNITFTLKRDAFESYDPNIHDFTFEEGFYEISAGLSSRDIQCSCQVYADVTSIYSYGENTSVKTITETPELLKILEKFFKENNLPWSAILTSYQYTPQDTIGMILAQTGCSKENARLLYNEFSKVKKR